METVARNASFTTAAAKLHVAQPAFSVAVRRLEVDLCMRLFERTSRRVSLTPAGSAFRKRASRVRREVQGLSQEMRDDDRVALSAIEMIRRHPQPAVATGQT